MFSKILEAREQIREAQINGQTREPLIISLEDVIADARTLISAYENITALGKDDKTQLIQEILAFYKIIEPQARGHNGLNSKDKDKLYYYFERIKAIREEAKAILSANNSEPFCEN